MKLVGSSKPTIDKIILVSQVLAQELELLLHCSISPPVCPAFLCQNYPNRSKQSDFVYNGVGLT